MGVVDETSLGATVDAVNEAFFFGRVLPKSEREAAAKWLAGRQGLKWSYAHMFAPTEQDLRGPAKGPRETVKGVVKVFTGERVASWAATAAARAAWPSGAISLRAAWNGRSITSPRP